MDKEMFEFYKNALQGVITNPLCADYKNEWRACGENKEKLIKLAMRQQSLPYLITHCYENKGVSMQYILEEFGDFINGRYIVKDADEVDGYTYAMNVGMNEAQTNIADVSAFLWCTNPSIRIPETKCPTLYVGCKSSIDLYLDGYNSLRVYLFDESEINIKDADDVSKILVYKYSPKTKIHTEKYCIAKINEFDKEIRL